MQPIGSDKTFHLKWNNHLQNLSQLFTTIYSSAALADVTLSCRDGTLKAHKLVLSACSPYFEQIFKDNPCQHPVIILKGIPFSEINLLVEFMYKGSVDVQELDLQSLMHTASELEIRGLAYEVRDNAAQLLNVNLEYPAYTQQPAAPAQHPYPPARTDAERLKQIHLYQQSMVRADELRRKRRAEEAPASHVAVNNILAAAAREMEEARGGGGGAVRAVASIQTEEGQGVKRESTEGLEEKPKKRVSIVTPEEEKLRKKKAAQQQYSVRNDDQAGDEGVGKLVISAVSTADHGKHNEEDKKSCIKVVQLSSLQKAGSSDRDDSDEHQLLQEQRSKMYDDDEDSDSSGSNSDMANSDMTPNSRPHQCDICDLRFQRSSHLNRHRLTHTGERPFTCGGCGRSFARSDKLRVHTKICERDDPTVDMMEEASSTKREAGSSEVMSGMVRTTHRESSHLMFTPSGDVMLAPRASSGHSSMEHRGDMHHGDLMPKRGRGRPRKTPLPLGPKIKKRRGRPPKTSLDMEGSVLTSGAVGPMAMGGMSAMSISSALNMSASMSVVASPSVNSGNTVPQQLHITPSGQHLLMKRKRGRPPKNFFNAREPGSVMSMPSQYGYDASYKTNMNSYGRPKENYNATNLPFGDFAYLTEMMYNPNPLTYGYVPPGGTPDADHSHATESSHGDSFNDTERTIDLSSSSSEEEEPADDVPPAAVETEIMTVGDCQILKLPPNEDSPKSSEAKNGNEVGAASTEPPEPPPVSKAVTITPIATVGDCTIQPVEGNT